MIASAPSREIPPPPSTQSFLEGAATRAVWVNELGGVTWEVGDGDRRCFLKWAPTGPTEPGGWFDDEVDRLAWVAPYWQVPTLLDRGHDSGGEWMATTALPGRNAVDPQWLADPLTAARSVGQALRALHDSVPVAACPFSWSVPERLARARAQSSDPVATEAAITALGPPPPFDRSVVCHGDACVPNTLLADDGRWTGHVDLGALGVGDPWADLAVATWSCEWNYGPTGHGAAAEAALLDGYGVERDADRVAYYRAVWNLE